jgi:DNA-binding transcriptional LysR family regulator
MVKDLIRRQQLVRLLPRWTGPAQTAYLVYARRRRQPMRVQVMMDMLEREIRSL